MKQWLQHAVITDVLFQAEAMLQMCYFVRAYISSRVCSGAQEVSLHVLQTEQADNSTWVAHTSCSEIAQLASSSQSVSLVIARLVAAR